MVTIEAGGRLDRRKARTRQALLDAARGLLAGGDAGRASIQEITEAADVGFGTFYNHFPSKDELFRAAIEQVLDELGAHLDGLSSDLEDPAEVFARSVRVIASVVRTDPQAARILVHHGITHLDSAAGIAPRALRDIELGVQAGRFHVGNPHLALSTAAGALLGLLQLTLARPDLVDDDAADELAEQLLRMLGLGIGEAAEIARRPLPPAGDLPRSDRLIHRGRR